MNPIESCDTIRVHLTLSDSDNIDDDNINNNDADDGADNIDNRYLYHVNDLGWISNRTLRRRILKSNRFSQQSALTDRYVQNKCLLTGNIPGQ